MSTPWNSRAERHPERTSSSLSSLSAGPQFRNHLSTGQSRRDAPLMYTQNSSYWNYSRKEKDTPPSLLAFLWHGKHIRARTVWFHLAGLSGLCLELWMLSAEVFTAEVGRLGDSEAWVTVSASPAGWSRPAPCLEVTAGFHWAVVILSET